MPRKGGGKGEGGEIKEEMETTWVSPNKKNRLSIIIIIIIVISWGKRFG
jgi:hypothetical protein